MAAKDSKLTVDHEEIRRWVEERQGRPATVKYTGASKDLGLLRIDFPGGADEESLQPISWEDFFKKFDARKLAFLYQEELSGGEESRFFKFVSREETPTKKRTRH
jgi:hypothetical protein